MYLYFCYDSLNPLNFNENTMWKRFSLMLLVALPFLAADLYSKSLAKAHLIGRGRLSYLGDSFRLEYATNTGSWGGLMGQLPETLRELALVYGVGLLLLGMVAYIVWKSHSRWETLGLSLVLSGGLGNLVDRAVQGYVVDFLNMGLGSLRTNIFNLADVYIMVGVGLFLLLQFRAEQSSKPTESVDKSESTEVSPA